MPTAKSLQVLPFPAKIHINFVWIVQMFAPDFSNPQSDKPNLKPRYDTHDDFKFFPKTFLSGAAIDQFGNLILADGAQHKIHVCDNEGKIVKTFGQQGSADGEFNCPTGLALYLDGSLVVVDSRNHRLQIFDSASQFLDKIGSFGQKQGELCFPCGLALDNNGNIVVIDNHRIQIFTPSGMFSPPLCCLPKIANFLF